jgi:uncharacterized protein
MKIRVDEIPPEGLSVEEDEEGSQFLQEDEALRFEGKIYSRVRLKRLDNFVSVTGSAKADAVLQCARCLEEFPVTINSEFSVEYRPVEEADTGREVQLLADEMDVLYYTDEQIDLNELVMGQVAESIPLKPLCSESCHGLCPHCGANLNQGDCDCGPQGGDPRFAKLKELLKNRDQ